VILPDLVGPGLRIIFCGTAAGAMSAQRGHYYANPGNRFWQLLADTGLTPRRLAPEEDHLMPSFGLGLTDLCKVASGQDAAIPASAYDPARLLALVDRHRPAILAFTSLTAARLAARLTVGPAVGLAAGPAAGRGVTAGPLPRDARLPGTVLWALPSPSGLARRHFSMAPWQALADRAGQCR
jgi:TDG/mug DNA glycosylase family protein